VYFQRMMNLGNAIEALCGPAAARGPLFRVLRDEGVKCLEAAGIDFVPEQEDVERRGDLLRVHPIGDQARGGGSTWQSVVRGTGSIETDHLNGEIVLLGRLHGVPTPANELMQELMFDVAVHGLQPGSLTTDTILERLGHDVTPT
jgi:2-dehydropantoate 2-reductase